jgi:hypothetical protein
MDALQPPPCKKPKPNQVQQGTALSCGGDVHHTPKKKLLVMKIFGKEREIGKLDHSLLTDTRTLIMAFTRDLKKKGRAVTLSKPRFNAVDSALKNTSFLSAKGLRSAMKDWYDGAQWDSNTVNTHYDQQRSEMYHEHNKTSQDTLTRRSAELTSARGGLWLDLACGSGLSCAALLKHNVADFVIGTDLSEEMLKTGRRESRRSNIDYILTDMSQPFPLRENSFDGGVSIGALHFLFREAAGRSAG